ncbi:FliO/MopB family protein [Austwickia chelonae]|uniref:FliO/MopB family protein n=1 Tax=Austwickia chelonae TaxID=100225 RepID=UPI000E220E3A|nr:flagellar biosynthetic protein FliO [Austwickia chelonae]
MNDASAVVLFLRMALSLAVVLALIVWAARVVNRRQGSLWRRPGVQVPMVVLNRIGLSRHAAVAVVEVGEEILVLGVTDTGMTLLSRIDPETLPSPEEDTGSTPGERGPLQPISSSTRSDGAVFAEAMRSAAGALARRSGFAGSGRDGGDGRHG